MYGWTGKILRVDLNKAKVSQEELDFKLAEKFVGSRGLGAKYLYDEIDPEVDALGPGNKLIFATGPLTGAGGPNCNRYMVVTKSPLTGAIANSNAGGFFPAEIKFAGYDLIIFEGKSKKPVYLWIENDQAEIRSAEKIWGMDTYETQDTICTETDENAKIACIGPAGEKLARIACIINDDGRAAGRGGVGAVMGSKNLKAVAVRGTKSVLVADKDGFMKQTKIHMESYSHPYAKAFGLHGTDGVALPITNEAGCFPTRNFQTSYFEGIEGLLGETLSATISKTAGKQGSACFGCPLGCGRKTKVTDPDFTGEGDGPEYETVGAFGSNCGIGNINAVAKAGYICNELGLDTISMGMTIATAMELSERGFLPEKDVGMKLNFGNSKAMVELVRQTGYREGFGDLLAEGSYRMAEKYGHPELSMSAKKQDFASYDPRGLQGLGLEYATQNRGACHIRGEVHNFSLFEVYQLRIVKDKKITFVNRFATEDKPLLTKEIQDWFCIIDSSGWCNFAMGSSTLDEDSLCTLLETATGVDWGGFTGLMKVGERIFNVERLFNLRAGLTAKDDTLPHRMLKEPVPSGPSQGHVVELEKMLPEYYRLRGWDDQGVPTRERLKELDLSKEGELYLKT
jgi:aldehyde:ferredoxin oxidoreductase